MFLLLLGMVERRARRATPRTTTSKEEMKASTQDRIIPAVIKPGKPEKVRKLEKCELKTNTQGFIEVTNVYPIPIHVIPPHFVCLKKHSQYFIDWKHVQKEYQSIYFWSQTQAYDRSLYLMSKDKKT